MDPDPTSLRAQRAQPRAVRGSGQTNLACASKWGKTTPLLVNPKDAGVCNECSLPPDTTVTHSSPPGDRRETGPIRPLLDPRGRREAVLGFQVSTSFPFSRYFRIVCWMSASSSLTQ